MIGGKKKNNTLQCGLGSKGAKLQAQNVPEK